MSAPEKLQAARSGTYLQDAVSIYDDCPSMSMVSVQKSSPASLGSKNFEPLKCVCCWGFFFWRNLAMPRDRVDHPS